MATAVIMPRQGQSVESCIITEWFKQKGDTVNEGELLFAYETDKASFEETAKVSGVLLDVFYGEGDEAPVLVNVAVIGQAGEDISALKGNSKSPEVQKLKSSKVEEFKSSEIASDTLINSQSSIGNHQSSIINSISPRAKRTAGDLGLQTSRIAGSGPQGRVIERDVLAAAQSQPRLTPLAKQIAGETGLQVDSGSGIGGRATVTDLKAMPNIYSNDYSDAKLTNIRKIIAKAMHESLQNSAQLTHHMSADVRKLLEFRAKLKATLGAPNITLNDMICMCVIRALKKMPEVNSHFLGDSIRTFNKIHLGLAVDTPRGLMVPTVRNADDLSLTGLSGQLKEIAGACKGGSIDPSLLASTAASFTVSNLGNYGVELFTPIINLPQVAILGVCTIVNRPTDLGSGVFGFVPCIGLSLTYDHRALDGGPATLFLKEIKTEIENWKENI